MAQLADVDLVLRPIEPVDTVPLHAIFIDEQVRRFLWDDEVIPLEVTRELVEKSRASFAESGFGIWGIRDIEDDALMGFAGYWHFHSPPSLELLFGLSPRCWGKGYATTAGRLLLRHGFDVLGFECVTASTDVGNEASIRVMERLGMKFDRRESKTGLDTVFYVAKPAAVP